MSTRNYREIYDRHRGPYSLYCMREVINGKGKVTNSHVLLPGPFSSEDAHEEARVLVKNAKEPITEVFVFSVTEGQFIGALYKRGGVYAPWHELDVAKEKDVEYRLDAGGHFVEET